MLAAAAAVLVATFAAAPAGAASLRPDQFGIASAHGLEARPPADLARELNGYQAVGARWVRFDIDWGIIQRGGRTRYDWAKFDAVIRGARLRGLDVLGIIAYSPRWARGPGTDDKHPPTNLADYTRFAAAVARRYGPLGVHHWQIWNEPNITNFWAPKPDPAAYARMLRATSVAIKRVDPQATILSAGTAPAVTDGTNYAPIDFLRALYAAGAGQSFDAVAHHASTFPAFPSEPHGWSAWHQMSGTTPSLRGVMVENGDSHKQIWITEFGAPTRAARAVTEAQQAAMLREAYTLLGSYPWAGPLFWYSYRDRLTPERAWQDFCGLVRADFSPKPAFNAYRSLSRGAFVRPPRNALVLTAS